MVHYKIYKKVKELPDTWDAFAIEDIFFKTNFLRGLEDSTPKNITSYYLGVFKTEKLVGIAIIQRVEMYVEDVFRKDSSSKIKQYTKQLVAKIVKGNALVVGNLMHTGQHGLCFNENNITQNEFLQTINKAIKDLIVEIKSNFNKKVRIIAFKDYFESDKIHKSFSFFKDNNLYKVQVQPNMVFSILETWKTTNDYIAAFNKKYRKRYRTALKKSKDLDFKELNTEYLVNHSKKIFKLYETVSDNAKVNSFKLPEDHFYQLKRSLKENFKVFGYFLNEELIGFYTLILNNNILETYFLGYKKELQQQYQMYLNMLFNMASFGIENNFKSIVYARTAMEIKSSIGAKPNTMHIYLKHTNNFIANTILKCIVKYMNPMKKWTERQPFKQ
ncbi:GNAT family N-acetyltransferase [Flavivirga aquatica]|uniref:GNAT family N-acetyltransferase n=1 Tax=Flavivirga aquatica TaxID=1849968 RepID=A0A1E5T3T5_9FLAO|nr:GNAT family N-acetyltransferase [Flavivirga aquatica]OEK06053.1 GNAT family N-acetyltransferase [Flavivirga aquatica]